MDVFKYLKQVNNHIKEAAADDAREMGLEYAGYGKWKDPKTGQVTHKSVKSAGQTTLQQLDKKEEPQKQDKKPKEKKTLSKFKKDAAQEPPKRMDLSVAKDADPEKTAEYSAMAAAQGMWPHYSDERKQYHIDQQKAMAAQAEAEAEAAAAAEEEKAAKEEPAPEEEKSVEDFRTVDEIRDEEEETTDDEIDEDDFDSQMSEVESEYQLAIKDANDRARKKLDKQYGAFREALSKIPAGSERGSFLQAMAHAKTFEGRTNSGAGKNNLGYADVQNLVANRDRLMEGYGDGSPEAIKKFVRSVRSQEVSDEFIDASFELLPKKFKDSLKIKGKVTGDKYVSDDKAHDAIHYLGKNDDGTAIRGQVGNNDRAKLMWRIYLEQGGRDAYTGLPLDIEAMDLEHVRGFNNSDDGKPGKEQFEQRENDDNFTLINSNVNQLKSNDSMEKFFAKHVDPLKDKGEDEFGGIEKLFEKQNKIGSVGEELSKTLLGEGGKGMGDSVTKEILLEHFGADDQRHTELRDEFRKAAGGDKKTAAKANSIKSKLGKTLLKAMGLPRGHLDPSGRRTLALQENVYRGFLQSVANAKPKDRQRYYDGYREAIKAGNEERSAKAVNRVLKELGLIDEDILNDRKAGRVFKEDFDIKSFIFKFRKS